MNEYCSISLDFEGLAADAVRFLEVKGKSPEMALREELADIRRENIFLSSDGSTIVSPSSNGIEK